MNMKINFYCIELYKFRNILEKRTIILRAFMHLMKIVFVEESIAAWSVVREKFQPLYILMQTINSYQFLTTIGFQNGYFIFRYFWHIIACAALLQRSVYDWHTLKKVPLNWSVHLDEICDVRKFCAQLVSAKYKQKRRPLSAEFRNV